VPPGDFIADRPVSPFIHPAGLPIPPPPWRCRDAAASWATRMRTATLHKVLAWLLAFMAAALVWTHGAALTPRTPPPCGPS
jgi:hypothetical protein